MRRGAAGLATLKAGIAGVFPFGARLHALRATEERLRQTIDGAPDAFVSIDADGHVLDWNAAAERIFGWSAEEAIGRELAALVVPETLRDAHRQGVARVRETAQSRLIGRPLELVGLHHDGHELPIELTIVAVPDAGGVSFNAFIRSTHERHKLSQERSRRIREHSARLEAEELARRAQRLQQLTDVALSHLSVDSLLDEVLRRMCSLLELDAASILMIEPDGRLEVHASTDRMQTGRTRAPLGLAVAGRVARERRPLLVHDPDPDGLIDPSLRRADIGSLVAIPLLAHDERLAGVMEAGAVRLRRFDENDVALLTLAGERVALALDRAAVFEREHRIATALQHALLPSTLPERPGMALAARYLPAAPEAEVGGDWYDAVVLPTGRVAVALGDVEGKGLRAASLVGGLRSAFRAYALDGHEPGEIVRRLSELLLADPEHTQIATVWVGALDCATGELVCASAGHPQPLVAPANGPARYLAGDGSVPLGVIPAVTYDEHQEMLASDDVLLVFTDGLVESRDWSLAEGLAQLGRVVDSAPPGADALCDHVLERMAGGKRLADDVAVIALGPTPLGGRLRIEVPSDARSLAGVRGLIERLLREEGIPDEQSFGIVLAAAEACNNAVEHAYGPRADSFVVEASADDGEVSIVVRDRGVWREQRDGDAGRGIDMMRALMDSVDIDSGASGTTARLLKGIAVGAAR